MPQQKRTNRKTSGGLAGQGLTGQSPQKTPTAPQQMQPAQRGSQFARIQGHHTAQNVQPTQAQLTPQQRQQLAMQQQMRMQQAQQQTRQNAAMPMPASKKEQKKAQKAFKKQQKQMQKTSAAKNKQAKKRANKNPQDKVGLFTRIRLFFQENNAHQMLQLFLSWVDRNYLAPIFVAVVFVAIGLLFNRYISFGAAFAILLLGVLMSRRDFERGSYCCYGAAIIAFIVPYLF